MTRIFNAFAIFFQKTHTFLSSLYKKTKKVFKTRENLSNPENPRSVLKPLNAYVKNLPETQFRQLDPPAPLKRAGGSWSTR